jgi:hypothetical protein
MFATAGGTGWDEAARLLVVLTPMVGVPLTVITFYLRSLRETQSTVHNELLHRIEGNEAALAQVRSLVNQFEREYATKEEWLRESMASRGHIERLSEAVIRLEAETEQTHALARQVESAARAVTLLNDRLRPTGSPPDAPGVGGPDEETTR